MNDLKSFAVLQARVYEFLERQDETTLQAIVSGNAQLAVARVDDAQAPVSPLPSRDPVQTARKLSRLASEQERRIHLNATKLTVKGLLEVAKLLGLGANSRLRRAELMDLLVGHVPDRSEAPAHEPSTPAPSPPVDGSAKAEQQVPAQEAPPTGTPKPDLDMAAIASRLRETESEEEGAAYLDSLHLDRESMLAVAAELQLTRVDRLSQKELKRRVLKQAIGDRRKFAGLRKW